MEKGSKRRRLPRGGRLFGPLVGLLWLAYPIQTLLKSNPSSAQILFALAGSTLFVAVFLGLIWLRTAIKKLGARNRVEAAHLAERKGWL